MKSTNPLQMFIVEKIPVTYVEIYKSSEYKKTVITKLSVSNISNEECGVTICIVPNGQTPNKDNQVVPLKVIDKLGFWDAYTVNGLILNEGDSIHCKADKVDSILINGAGVEIY